MGDAISSARKVLRVFKALRGHTLNGVGNGELAQATGLSPSHVSRAMADLISEGLAEKRPDGRFCLSVAALAIAHSHAAEITAMRDRMDEINRRISAHAGAQR